jgi:hypothetical protein
VSRPGDRPDPPRGLPELKDLVQVGRDITIEMVDRGESVAWVSPAGVISVAYLYPYHCKADIPLERQLPWEVRYRVRQIVRTVPPAGGRALLKVTMTRPQLLAEITSAVAFLPHDEIGNFPIDEEVEHSDIFSMLLCDEPVMRQPGVHWLVLPKVRLRGADENGAPKVMVTTQHSVPFAPRRLVIPSSVSPDVTIGMRVGMTIVEESGTPASMFSERALGTVKVYPVLHPGATLFVEVCNPTPDDIEFTPVVVGLVVEEEAPEAEERLRRSAEDIAAAVARGADPAALLRELTEEQGAALTQLHNEVLLRAEEERIERRVAAERVRRVAQAALDPTIWEMVARGEIVPTAAVMEAARREPDTRELVESAEQALITELRGLAAPPPVVEGGSDEAAEGEEDGAPPP